MIWKIDVGFHGRGKGNEGGLLRKALEGSTIHTQDSNEPLNTRRKGGEFVYQCRVVDTTALHRKSKEEDGAADSERPPIGLGCRQWFPHA